MIDKVYHFANGMTAVFDERGNQMPELQGYTSEVWPKLVEAGWKGPTPHEALWEIKAALPVFGLKR